MAKKLAGCNVSSLIGLPSRSVVSDVVMIADLIAAGDQSGCAPLISAAMPLRWGVDIEVPDIILKVAEVTFVSDGPTWKGHAATTFRPGPMMSGFRMPGLWRLGPREEKKVTTGAGEVPKLVPWKEIVASGLSVELM
ncbi:hypothetical protein ACMD2_14352 [Ananas comosus]|uniref:Uncharacterized protein n=1 Tax=Ananas comosus TaxID=4615 RepID=A0A199UII5_ANACO|nr:hypothetical protein ACMD2_14352 [Ananas comosus]